LSGVLLCWGLVCGGGALTAVWVLQALVQRFETLAGRSAMVSCPR